MLENTNFNTLINHIVFTMDILLKDKGYSDELKDFLYLIVIGMILSYGDEYMEDIYNMIATVKFKNNIDIRDYSDNRNKLLSYVNPTEHNYLSKLFDFNCNFPVISFNYELLYKKIDSSNIKTLEYLVHELNYVLFNKNKKYSLINSIRIRYDYYKNDIRLDRENEDISTFNRIFNVLQSENIVMKILELRDMNITNKKVNNALNKLSNIDRDTYKFEGMDMLVNLFRPLYSIPDTKKFIDKSIFYDIDLVEKEFDTVLGKNSYKNVCKKLDNLNGMIFNSKNGHNNYYALSLEYVFIRNNFVNRYLNTKLVTV